VVSGIVFFFLFPLYTQLLILILDVLFEDSGHADFVISTKMWPCIDTFFQQEEKKYKLSGYFPVLKGLCCFPD